MLKSSQVALARAHRSSRQLVRRWCVAAAAASLMYSALASALGLGEITLHSALEQPFNADIELVETAGLSAEDIHVGLASPEAFSRAGVDRLFFFNDLRFTTVINGNRGVVHVVSKKPVSEPYLSFLVRLSRPNGDIIHTYTLLIDPPDSPQGRMAAQGRWVAPTTHTITDARMPVAPPQAVQGNHYTVVKGDTLAIIARRLQGPDAKNSSADIARGIQALNTQAFPNGNNTRLKAGQSLLLPDTAVLPLALAAPVVASADVPAVVPPSTVSVPQPLSSEDQKTAEQLAANAIENQQLSKSVGDLKGQLQGLEDQVEGKDKQVIALQTALAEMKTAATKPAVPAPVAVAAPVATVAPEDDSLVSMPLLLGAVLILLLLLGLAYSIRRKRKIIAEPAMPAYAPVEPTLAPLSAAPVVESPRVVVAPSAPVAVAPSVPSQRLAGTATDALDGASIYIAYGRFTEALGILRDASVKQPQRTDLRLRILELVGEQGDSQAFAREEQSLLDHGVSAETVQEIRQRYPKLQVKPEPVPAQSPTIAVPSPSPSPSLPAAVAGGIVLAAELAPEPVESRFIEPDAPVPVAQPVDEFHLNLDDLSLDADWDLVDPFETTPAARTNKQVEPAPDMDADFATNLTEFPEVFEMPDEQYLSDFAEPEVEVELEPQPIIQSNSDLLDDEFLDGFMGDSTEFDLLDLVDDEPLSKINQAQLLIDDGELERARTLLQEVILDGDHEHQRTAQDLLAGIS